MIDDKWLDISIAGDLYVAAEQRAEFGQGICRRLSGRDLICINLEGPVCRGKQKMPKIGPNLCQTEEAVRILKRIGCHLVTLANNHIMDYGTEGLQETTDCLRREGIAYTGAGNDREEIYKPYIIEKGEIRVGVINAAENGFGCLDDSCTDHGGYAWIFSRHVKAQIQRLKETEKCDKIIGIFHAGAEEVYCPLPEWRSAYREFIDLGMDLVVAHHPHVPQGCECYAGKKIYYSLGNFMWCSDRRQGKSSGEIPGKFGLVLNLHIEKNKEMEDDLVYVKEDGTVMEEGETEKADEYLHECSRVLLEENDGEYRRKTAEICDSLYENYYKQYIKETIGVLQNRNFGRFTRLKHYLLNVKRALFADYEINKRMLFHNLQIETCRWICMHAVRDMED